jgi:transposase
MTCDAISGLASVAGSRRTLLIQRLLRQHFGPRSEQLSHDQLQLGLEDLEQTIAKSEPAQDAADKRPGASRQPAEPQSRRPVGTPPRDEVVSDIENRASDAPRCKEDSRS